MLGSAVVTTRLSSTTMNRARPVMTRAQMWAFFDPGLGGSMACGCVVMGLNVGARTGVT